MAIYNPKSLKAEEFINDGEILDTLQYAEANKNNKALIEEILEKARPKKTAEGTVCAGLSHREAALLLLCDDPTTTPQQCHNKNSRYFLGKFRGMNRDRC